MVDVTALGVGLAGMRERMRQLGGALRVSTSPRGTCVQAKLALTRNAGTRIDQLASL
jgi:signal transduction histidine kinase